MGDTGRGTSKTEPKGVGGFGKKILWFKETGRDRPRIEDNKGKDSSNSM
jgi:hypothetical protein